MELLILLALLGAVFAAVFGYQQIRSDYAPRDESTPPGKLIALIEEKATFTTRGVVWGVLLAASQLLWLSVMMMERGAPQQTVVGVVWIATNVVLCTALILCRSKTYRVMSNDSGAEVPSVKSFDPPQ